MCGFRASFNGPLEETQKELLAETKRHNVSCDRFSVIPLQNNAPYVRDLDRIMKDT
jgi:hypothetical protein